jgi:prophage regulatory protein
MRFMRIKEVLKLTGLSKSSIYADPTFPVRVKIGSQAAAWVEGEVSDWMASRVKERNEELAAMEQRQ